MNKERYLSLIHWAGEQPARKKIFCFLNRSLPIVIGGIYILCLLGCLFVYPVLFFRLALRPALCFLTVTVLRKILKFPRPYDVYGYIPLCDHHPGKGCSFPSRHTASAAIIALEIFHLWRGIGAIILLFALLVGLLRILCGNHFIKDVLSAYGIALLFNIL